MLSVARRRGHSRTTGLRAVTDAIFYITQSGYQWRLPPKEFPPCTTVQRNFHRWRRHGAEDQSLERFPGERNRATILLRRSSEYGRAILAGLRQLESHSHTHGNPNRNAIMHEANIQDRDGIPTRGSLESKLNSSVKNRHNNLISCRSTDFERQAQRNSEV